MWLERSRAGVDRSRSRAQADASRAGRAVLCVSDSGYLDGVSEDESRITSVPTLTLVAFWNGARRARMARDRAPCVTSRALPPFGAKTDVLRAANRDAA